jgi:O-antigen ligase
MERKQNPSSSWALWIPTVWILKIQTLDLAYWIGKGDAEQGSGSPYERSFLIFLLCLGLIIIYKRRLDWYKALKNNTWLAALIGYMFLSIFWSDIPFTSFKRWTRELIAVIMALVILSEADPRKALESLLRRSIYILIPLSLLLVVFFPEVGTSSSDMVSWNGLTGGKNELGRLCFISIFFLVWTLVRSRQGRDAPVTRQQTWIDVAILGIALYLMKGPGMAKALSLTSIITLVLGLGTFFGLLWMQKLKRVIGIKTLKVVIAACIVLGTASVFVGGLVVGESVITTVGREETLTGRSEIWAKFLPHAMSEPFIGHGIGGFWTDEVVNRYFLNQAHSGYLDILLDYGFVGLLFFSLFLLSSCQKAHRELSHDYNWGSCWICFLVMSATYSVSEATIDSFTSDLTAILLFLYVSSATTPNSGKA